MNIIKIDTLNIDKEHICCAIGNDKENRQRADTKKCWMKDRFLDGLIFKRLDARGKAFIEYMPIEKVWKPLEGTNYMIINCLWVSGQFKGKGIARALLNECITESNELGMDGVAVVCSSKTKPFLTDKKFFIKFGFEVVDVLDPYFELLALKLKNNNLFPKFNKYVKTGNCPNKKGFTFIYANQCPFVEIYVNKLSDIVRNKGVQFNLIKLNSSIEAKEIGSPFGTYGLYYEGKFLTHELMAEAKFEKYIEDILDGKN